MLLRSHTVTIVQNWKWAFLLSWRYPDSVETLIILGRLLLIIVVTGDISIGHIYCRQWLIVAFILTPTLCLSSFLSALLLQANVSHLSTFKLLYVSILTTSASLGAGLDPDHFGIRRSIPREIKLSLPTQSTTPATIVPFCCCCLYSELSARYICCL